MLKLFILLSEYASSGGHLDIMKVLIQHGARLHETKGILDTSVIQGYDDIVDFVLSQEYVQFKDKEYALREATNEGHLCVLKTLISPRSQLHQTGYRSAASRKWSRC